MNINEAQAWAIIIATTFTGIVSVVTAFVGVRSLIKTEKVHNLVNSAMTAEKAENAMLRSMLVAKQIVIDTQEKAATTLADAVNKTTEVSVSKEHTAVVVPKELTHDIGGKQ